MAWDFFKTKDATAYGHGWVEGGWYSEWSVSASNVNYSWFDFTGTAPQFGFFSLEPDITISATGGGYYTTAGINAFNGYSILTDDNTVASMCNYYGADKVQAKWIEVFGSLDKTVYNHFAMCEFGFPAYEFEYNADFVSKTSIEAYEKNVSPGISYTGGMVYDIPFPEYRNGWEIFIALLMGDIQVAKKTYLEWEVYLDGSGRNVRKCQYVVKPSLDLLTAILEGEDVQVNLYKADFPSAPSLGQSTLVDSAHITAADLDTNGAFVLGTYKIMDLYSGTYIPLLSEKYVTTFVDYFYDDEKMGVIGSSIWFDEKENDRLNLDANRLKESGEVGKPDDGSTLTYIIGYYESPEDSPQDGSGDDPNSDKIPESTGYDSSGILTKTYAMTKERCQSLGSFLWSASFIDNIKLVNNSPIENIVAIKVFPFSLTGTDESIVLGNVNTGVSGAVLSNNTVTKQLGSLRLPHIHGNFLDYAPYTKVSIHLPFIGFRNIDTNFYLDRTLSVSYIIDLVTGSCKAILYADGTPVESYDGSMGIDVPLVGSNRAQLEAGYVSSFVGGIASGVSGGMAGVAEGALSATVNNAFSQFHSEKAGGTSPQCSAYMTKECFVVIDYPEYSELIGSVINHTKGRMCMQTARISDCKGYTQTSPDVDLSNVNCTETEKDMLRSILSSGFFA